LAVTCLLSQQKYITLQVFSNILLAIPSKGAYTVGRAKIVASVLPKPSVLGGRSNIYLIKD
jgi:hypothetical protein